MQRRQFLASYSALTLSPFLPLAWTRDAMAAADFSELNTQIPAIMKERHVPGVNVCLLNKDDVIWSNSYGFADLERRIPMTFDTIQNIGSISKTFAATAIMQLKEYGLLNLDRDINDYLPFSIRNPKFPDTPVTTRQLMIHLSSLRDGSAYSKNYACGDPKISLAAWIKEFFSPDGVFYNASENFEDWKPGTKWKYCNLSFGVLGLIVESISGIPFEEYCQRNIFKHLRMHSTAWLLSEIDQTRHTVPYSWVENGRVRGQAWGDVAMGVVRQDGLTMDTALDDGYQINCLYNHPNYPDGFLRTTVNDLGRYARAWLNDGAFQGRRILRSETVEEMFSKQKLPKEEEGKRTYGLTWYALEKINNSLLWGHGGGDPGIGTGIIVLRDLGLSAIVFTNTASSGAPKEILSRLLKLAIKV